MQEPFTIVDGPGPVVAVALHAGHELRDEVAALIGIDDGARLREEDPRTERLAEVVPCRTVVRRSRFEVDLNRDRQDAVYRGPEDAWGLPVWRRPLPEAVVVRSLAIHDAFLAAVGERFDRLAAAGPFVVLDVHSYNHCRDGRPGPEAENPEVNLGTRSVSHRWRPLVERFVGDLAAQQVRGHHLDVRENVRFGGGAFARWVHRTYPDAACVLSLEFKKTFMDERTGDVDEGHLAELRTALAATMPGLERALGATRA